MWLENNNLRGIRIEAKRRSANPWRRHRLTRSSLHATSITPEIVSVDPSDFTLSLAFQSYKRAPCYECHDYFNVAFS